MITNQNKNTRETYKKPVSKALLQVKNRRINTKNVAVQRKDLKALSIDPLVIVNKVTILDRKKGTFKAQFKAYIKTMLQKTLEGEEINYRTRETLAGLMAKDLGYIPDVSVITKCSQLAVDLGLEAVQYDHLNSNIVMMNLSFYNLPFTWRVLQALKNLPTTLVSLSSKVITKIATLYKTSKTESTPQREILKPKFLEEISFEAKKGVPLLSNIQKWKTSQIRDEDDHMRWYCQG